MKLPRTRGQETAAHRCLGDVSPGLSDVQLQWFVVDNETFNATRGVVYVFYKHCDSFRSATLQGLKVHAIRGAETSLPQ